MSILQFTWSGDLDENKTQRLQNPEALYQEKCHPMTMTVRKDKKETRIGRKNSKMPPDYALESAVSNRMISRNHVTIERLSKGNYMLYDHSLNGTYVNYCRVIGGTILKNDDVVCFGHINGANIKPGESVTPFSTDLKYRVEIIERAAERVSAHCDNFSEQSSDEREVAPKIHNRSLNESRKQIKPQKPPSEHSADSSDSSDISNTQDNSYIKRKKAPASSSSSEDDRLKQSIKERPVLTKTEKNKKHSSSLSASRYSAESAIKRKSVPDSALHKPSQLKKSHDSKRPRIDDERRRKDQRIHSSHSKSSHSKSKYTDNKSVKRTNNVNYDLEECRAQPCRRPDGENPIDWILCDKCDQWFHQFCVGLDEALEDDESYYCPYCAR